MYRPRNNNLRLQLNHFRITHRITSIEESQCVSDWIYKVMTWIFFYDFQGFHTHFCHGWPQKRGSLFLWNPCLFLYQGQTIILKWKPELISLRTVDIVITEDWISVAEKRSIAAKINWQTEKQLSSNIFIFIAVLIGLTTLRKEEECISMGVLFLYVKPWILLGLIPDLKCERRIWIRLGRNQIKLKIWKVKSYCNYLIIKY